MEYEIDLRNLLSSINLIASETSISRVERELPSEKDVIKNSSRIKPGLSEDLMSLQSEIAKNVNYVLGKKVESTESGERETINDKEETYDW